MNLKLYTLYTSTNPKKKYDVYVINPKTGRIKKVSFGATGYDDYTTHHDKERRKRYRLRHQNDKDDPMYAGFWSNRVLWGDSTDINVNMKKAIKYISKNKKGL